MKTQTNDFRWLLGGESGFGIKVTGQMFSRMCVRGGLHIFDYTEYPSLIRGGHNSFHVAVRDTPVRSHLFPLSMIAALNQETIDRHAKHLSAGGAIVFDPDMRSLRLDGLDAKGIKLFPIPLAKIAKETGGNILMRNAVVLGATVALVNYDIALLESVLHTAFDRKGEKVVAANIQAGRAGYDYALRQFSHEFPWTLKRTEKSPPRMTVTGNTAIAMGALAAGCGYYASYPMTPTSSLLTYLAKHAEETGMVVRHAEDEIGAINSAIGASYAGARSMVGTAGGGYALMVEATGLAGMTEVPLVIVVGQRPGPSTGMPTWTSQADLQFVLHAGQDEFPRIVLAPGDVRECFAAAAEAFNLADRYQTPVLLLTDKFLGESHMSTEPFDVHAVRRNRGDIARSPRSDENGMFARYRPSETGVSPRSLPGTADGIFTANSDEHDAYGAVSEAADERIRMMEKRMRKLETARANIPLPMLYGPKEAAITLIGWGSTKGPMLEAASLLEQEGIAVNVLHFVYVHPLPKAALERILRGLAAAVIVENNFTGQFAHHLKQEVGFVASAHLNKYDGRPFSPDEIAAHVRSLHSSRHGTS